MSAFVERRRPDNSLVAVHEVPPDECTLFFTEKQAGQIGHSILVHCMPNDSCTKIYDGLSQHTSVDPEDQDALRALCIRDNIRRVVLPERPPFTALMEDKDEGVFQVIVKHEGDVSPSLELLSVPMRQEDSASMRVQRLQTENDSTIIDYTGQMCVIKVIFNEMAEAHVYGAPLSALGHDAYQLVRTDPDRVGARAISPNFHLVSMDTDEEPLTLPIINEGGIPHTLLIRNTVAGTRKAILQN